MKARKFYYTMLQIFEIVLLYGFELTRTTIKSYFAVVMKPDSMLDSENSILDIIIH